VDRNARPRQVVRCAGQLTSAVRLWHQPNDNAARSRWGLRVLRGLGALNRSQQDHLSRCRVLIYEAMWKGQPCTMTPRDESQRTASAHSVSWHSYGAFRRDPFDNTTLVALLSSDCDMILSHCTHLDCCCQIQWRHVPILRSDKVNHTCIEWDMHTSTRNTHPSNHTCIERDVHARNPTAV
jgi:hypothetical protein